MKKKQKPILTTDTLKYELHPHNEGQSMNCRCFVTGKKEAWRRASIMAFVLQQQLPGCDITVLIQTQSAAIAGNLTGEVVAFPDGTFILNGKAVKP
jgi:hypothetical protein